jgi:hypothetical protein
VSHSQGLRCVRSEGYGSGERELWRQVLIRVLLDAAGSMAGQSRWSTAGHLLRAEARLWLTSESLDFHLVCDFAGFEPTAVRAAGLRLAREPEYAAHVIAQLCGKINPRCFSFLNALRETDGSIDHYR